ncbi:hypothetical protein LINPERHAP1_LOCUS12918, partial [Linum perenne]
REETTSTVKVTDGHVTSGTTKKLPSWKGKRWEGDKDQEGKSGRRRKKKKKERKGRQFWF